MGVDWRHTQSKALNAVSVTDVTDKRPFIIRYIENSYREPVIIPFVFVTSVTLAGVW